MLRIKHYIKQFHFLFLILIISIFIMTGCSNKNKELQEQYEQSQEEYAIAEAKLEWIEKYNSITHDMSIEQVSAILGNYRTRTSSQDVYFMEVLLGHK